MSLPNLLIIGAPKAGTTSIYNYLSKHKDVFMSPVKETYGLMKNEFNLCSYEEYFLEHTVEKYIGEATPFYLYSPNVPYNIKQYIPNAKMICILRNPVDRAFSHYLMNLNLGKEKHSRFENALDSESRRIEKNVISIFIISVLVIILFN